MEWTDKKFNEVVKHAKIGWSSQQIAEMLVKKYQEPCTRLSVVGICHRRGYKFPAGSQTNLYRSKAKVVKTAQEKIRIAAENARNERPIVNENIRGEEVELHGRVILGAGQDPVGCKYIHGIVDGTTDGWRYCQGKRHQLTPYCRAHQLSRSANA